MSQNQESANLSVLAARTPCPSCLDRTLEFVLHCDLAYGSCLYTARCGACGRSFEIVVGEEEPDGDSLREVVAPCPGCGARERRASLHCELRARSCVYKLCCASCGRLVQRAGTG